MAGAPTIASLFAQRVVIGVGDVAVSNNAQVTLSTYALGSCVGVVVYDPGARAGGLLHLMLPESQISPEKAQAQPAMFADTGLPLLFRSMVGLRAERSRLRVFVAGGASVLTGPDSFKIGERNVRATMDYLTRQGLAVRDSDVGGTVNRTLHLEVGSGTLTLKTPTANDSWSLAD
ncbi:MAG TPA: chemotaxis protein CheD [Opitutaceae bacterium]|nr:chemotaxis protein CheD [Opitutaceae bacterium]HND63014.1 chemotaxis protein CheD [Opitutaceae bacterium]